MSTRVHTRGRAAASSRASEGAEAREPAPGRKDTDLAAWLADYATGIRRNRDDFPKHKNDVFARVMTEKADGLDAAADLIRRLRVALRTRSIVGHVRLSSRGGTVPSGGSCALCNTEWSLFDNDGNRLAKPGKEHHRSDCLLATASPLSAPRAGDGA